MPLARGISEPTLRISGGSPPSGPRPGAGARHGDGDPSGGTAKPSTRRRAVAGLVDDLPRHRERPPRPRASPRLGSREPGFVPERMMDQRHQPEPPRLALHQVGQSRETEPVDQQQHPVRQTGEGRLRSAASFGNG